MSCKIKADEGKFHFIRLTDCEDGNPMLIRADVTAIFTETPDKTVLTNMMGQELREVVETPPRTIVLAEGYRWKVMESVDEVWQKLDAIANL